MKPYVIGISGGSASGKTTVCNALINNLKELNYNVSVLSQDNFYKGLTENDDASNYNFDHPDAINFNRMVECLKNLKLGNDTEIPKYDFVSHKSNGTEIIKSYDIIIVEGILVFYNYNLRNEMDLKLFVEASPEARAFRRMKRDMTERGRTLESIQIQYMKYVKPSYDIFISPTKEYADLLVGNETDHLIGVDVIVGHICKKIK